MQHNITYRQKDGNWQYIISYKQNGKWKQKSKQGFRTRGLAKIAADKRLDELKENLELESTINEEYSNITFSEFKNIYLRDKEIHRENNTIINYTTALNSFEKIEDIKMKDIHFIDIQECVNEMVKKDLSPSTINIYIARVKNLFTAAIKPYGVISKNPIDSKFIIPSPKHETKIKALTKSELDELLNKIKPQTDYIICLLAATTGMRLGEILGLCEPDIDTVASTIKIHRQWKKLKNGDHGFGTVKTKNSNRIIPVSPNTMAQLVKYINNNKVKDLNRRLFSGKDTSTTSVRLSLKFKRLGYDNSVHDLRHTYATMLIANGVDFKTVSNLLGDTVETVMKTYSHVTSDMTEKVTKKINSIF